MKDFITILGLVATSVLLDTIKGPCSGKQGEHIPGGTASGMNKKDFNQAQLRQGTRVELEHTQTGKKATQRQRAIASEIAMDHLAEDPSYYKKLKTIHSD